MPDVVQKSQTTATSTKHPGKNAATSIGDTITPNSENGTDVSNGLRALLQYLQDENFVFSVGMWAWNHCEEFPEGEPTSWEHQHAYADMHNDYKEIFDNRVERFFESGIDPTLPNEASLLSQVHFYLQKSRFKIQIFK